MAAANTEATAPNLHMDDLVRLPNDTLAFVSRLPGHESDTSSDTSSSSAETSSTEPVTNPRGRVVRFTDGMPHASMPVFHPPVLVRQQVDRHSLINTYEDVADVPAADPPPDRCPGESRHCSAGNRVPVGSVLVSHPISGAVSLAREDDLRPVDRAFDPGNLVLPVASDGRSQAALVESVRKLLLVRRVVDILPTTSYVPDPDTCFEVDGHSLGFFAGIRAGDSVVKGDSVGAIDYFYELVYVQFPDGAVACVPGHEDSLKNVDARTPDRVPPDPFCEGLYYPGQRVVGLPEVWMSAAIWIHGRYSGVNEGIVKSVRVGDVGVEWIAKNMFYNSGKEIPLPLQADDNGIVPVKCSDLTYLEAFRPAWWSVGDRGFLVKSGDAIPVDEYGECEADGEWEEDVGNHAMEDTEGSQSDSAPHAGADSSEAQSPYASLSSMVRNRAPRKTTGRFMKAQRRVREKNGLTAVEGIVRADSTVCNPFVNPADVVQVVGCKTFIDVLWQDGHREKDLSALQFRRHDFPDPYDFWPGELVYCSLSGFDEGVRLAENGKPGRQPAVLVRMCQHDRTAVVKWATPDGCLVNGTEETVSMYDLKGDESYITIGETVLHIPEDSVPNQHRLDWVGVVIGLRDGMYSVRWLGGSVSDVRASGLVLIMQGDDDSDDDDDDDDDDDEGSYNASDVSSLEDRGGVYAFGNGLTSAVERGGTAEFLRNWGPWGGEIGNVGGTEDGTPVATSVMGIRCIERLVSNACLAGIPIEMSDDWIETSVRSGAQFAKSALDDRKKSGRPDCEDGRFVATLLFHRVFSEVFGLSVASGGGGPADEQADLSGEAKGWRNIEKRLIATVQELLNAGSEQQAGNTNMAVELRSGGENDVGREAIECSVSRFEVVEDLEDFHSCNGKREDGGSGSANGTGDGRTVVRRQAGFGGIVNREWKRLEGSLPAGIFVRASEKRNDRIRAIIVGPVGTPYADFLFMFDMVMGAKYPLHPPEVWFHSYGRRLNPNLYDDGKVCLSILGTWDGDGVENWNVKHSNLLRVLVSLQALVFVDEPYFNEAGFQKHKDTIDGTIQSRIYNESTLLLSLRHCLTSVLDERFPKDCADVLWDHYIDRGAADRILKRCWCLIDSCDEKELDLYSRQVGGNGAYRSTGFRKSLKTVTEQLQTAFETFKQRHSSAAASTTPVTATSKDTAATT